MDRHRVERSGERHRTRWSSGSPTHGHDNHRYSRGGGGSSGGGENFSGGGGGGGGRYHPYRGGPDYERGFRSGNGGGSPSGGFGGPSMNMSAPRRSGFSSGRGDSPEHEGRKSYVKLFIGSVPRTATEEEIRPLFEEHGNVIEVALIKDRKTGEQQGCCFIKYATSEEAERAMRALHNQYTLPGGIGPIQVRYADGERERHGGIEHKLFVASMGRHATAKDIEEVFGAYGHVEDIYIMRDGMKQSRGCGFVKFSNREGAMAAMNALNGNYVMRGCDQPLIVRFADPKRPRPGESRGGPAFGGPGFSPRSDAALVIRPTANLDEPRDRRMPPDSWRPASPRSQFNKFGPDPGLPITTSSDNASVFTPTIFPGNGSVPGHSAPPSSGQLGMNPPAGQVRPNLGQQMPQMQKPLMSPQNFPPMQLPITPQMPPAMGQAGPVQLPQSAGLTSFGQGMPSMQIPGLGVQIPNPQQFVPQNAPSAGMGMQQQQQQPQQVPQMMLQQQAQALQSSFQSSQQAILQLQHQLHLMQQQHPPKQQQQQQQQQPGMAGHPATTSTPAVNMPATQLPATTPAAAGLTCNWTEHTSPEGFKYYYNSITKESKWEKPEEFVLYEQQKMLLLQQQQQQQQQQQHLQQQQQQKLGVQLQSPSQAQQSLAQMQNSQQQIPHSQQLQIKLQPQLQQFQPPLQYQTPAVAAQQNMQDIGYAQLQAATAALDPSRIQQGIQAMQEWAWKNKPAGS